MLDSLSNTTQKESFSSLTHHSQLSWPKLRSLKLTFPELRAIVASNDKQRFTLIPFPTHSPKENDPSLPTDAFSTENREDDPSQHLIRANQGHSIAIESEKLLREIKPSDPDFPEEVVHGTFPAAWELILKSGGLKPMGRTHVHFATGLPDAPPVLVSGDGKDDSDAGAEGSMKEEVGKGENKVISGMRKGASILVWVDVRRSSEVGGLRWWRSANGVVLTEGGKERKVGLEWVKRVVKRASGAVIWESGDGQGEGKAKNRD